MPRYIRAKGRRSRRSTETLQNDLLRDLETEGKKILRRLTEQAANEFLGTLQSESEKALKSSLTGGGTGGALGPISLSGFGNILESALNAIVYRPRTSRSTKETQRSKEADERFRLSRHQSLAEAGIELNKGEKNL